MGCVTGALEDETQRQGSSDRLLVRVTARIPRLIKGSDHIQQQCQKQDKNDFLYESSLAFVAHTQERWNNDEGEKDGSGDQDIHSSIYGNRQKACFYSMYSGAVFDSGDSPATDKQNSGSTRKEDFPSVTMANVW